MAIELCYDRGAFNRNNVRRQCQRVWSEENVNKRVKDNQYYLKPHFQSINKKRMSVRMENQSQSVGQIKSKDGTIVSYQVNGSGPGLIIIPGVLSIANNYNVLAEYLSKNFTVYTIERRGRGLSGPQGDDYGINKECEDVLAVREKARAQYLFGHSYGGLIALEVARNNDHFLRIALYEPAVSIDGSISMSWIPSYKNAIDKKKHLDAFATFSIAAGPEKAQKTPHWVMKLMLPFFIPKQELKQMFSLLEENLKEHKEVARKDNTYKNYEQISAGVLLMYGGKTGLKWVNKAIAALSDILPSSEVKEFYNLDHFGPDKKAPHEISLTVKEFFIKN
ncbi:alpha/beta hydrolase [Segetibacter koreensis]|uniref:alpha/beta hydrolase n=1 Tax=Segetibacter koreensis TaxID=398037 RepID=UPI001B7F8D9C|nr:alpha/beta hydrolase [Segetibacter koreensis]